MLGDVNCNGVIEVLDALQILRSLVGLSNVIHGNQNFPEGVEATPEDARVAGNIVNLSSEGMPVVADALQILRYLVGLSNLIDGTQAR